MMSENLVSEPMSVEDGYGSRMYQVTSTPGSSMENILMESQGPLNFSSTQPQLSMSNIQGAQSQQLRVAVSQELSGSHFQVKPLFSLVNNTVSQQILAPNWSMKQMQAPETSSGDQKSLLPNKRKATLELISNDPSTKKVAQISSLFNSSGMPALAVPNRKVVPMGSMSNSPRSMTSSKKKLPSDSSVNRSQPHAQKNQKAQTDPPNRAASESSNSVRSKLKESLAAALALVFQGHENTSNSVKNVHTLAKKLEDSLTPRSNSDIGVACSPDPGKGGKPAAANLSCPIEECRTTKSFSETIDPKQIAGDSVETWKFVGQEFQSNPVLTYEDASFNDSFFGKDELLLGNGLSWELDVDIVDVKEAEACEKAKLATHQGAGNDKGSNLPCSEPLPCPEFVASKIEAELFKLFGGVNKKYKEKGRSLLFNLKDKNNPELRERVMSGKISPEKLCSMTAEDLASKELSDWRIAKAEELAQMKVLPDTEVDLRRLVKKTHKGEFQVVEVERDVSAPVDITVGSSTLSVDQPQDSRRKVEHSRAESSVQADEAKERKDPSGKKSNNEDSDGQCQLTIPGDSGDVMHGLMVDDIKDLPPIVSLDEFMESLDKEPPFENLHGDSGTTPGSGKETYDIGGDANSSDQTSKHPGKKTEHKSGEVDSKNIISNASVKSTSVKKGPEIYPASGLINGECIWEGLLQLSISSMANFVGIYRSGEKTSTKEWPRFFEIKGRVRLDAFQRFLQDLPMSRSRAVMVVHFALAEGCTDNDRKYLEELVDSYVADQRLGFAEPAPGFEIYFIPPQTATVDMLCKQLAKDYTKTLKTIDNGLIGIVIWRKTHLTPTTTLHKDNAKRQQLQPYNSTTIANSRPSEQALLNSNVNFASTSGIMSKSRPDNNNNVDDNDDDDDDDDVPPGFGPPTAKQEDDDLPEFKFSGSGRGGLSPSFNPPVPPRLSSPTPSRSVDQVRRLIQKYGKTVNGNAGGITLQAWDDDDDDIPEWQPEVLPTQPPILPQGPHMANMGHLQQPTGGGPSGMWWHGGPAQTHIRSQDQGRQHQDKLWLVAGQQGRQWRSDGHRYRGRGF